MEHPDKWTISKLEQKNAFKKKMRCKYDLKSLFHVLNHSSSRNNNNEINTSLKEKEATTGCAFTRKHFFPEVDITWYKTFALCYQSREKMFIWRSNSVIITWKRSLD